MKKVISLLLASLFFYTISIAQNSILQASNAQPIDEKRYKGILGSPNYFKDWVKATLIATNGDKVKDVLLNFNGDTQEIEVKLKMENKMIRLEEEDWAGIEVLAKDNKGLMPKQSGEKVIIKSVNHRKFKGQFSVVLYEGEKMKLVKRFRAVETENEIQDVGKTIIVKRFKTERDYFLISGTSLKVLKLKKKQILSTLEHTKKLEKFIKQNKFKLKSEQELVKLIEFYESL